VTPHDYDYLRRLLRERSGLVLSADKQYLVESRLLPVSRRAGFAGLNELVQRLRAPGAEALAVEVVEAMTTNESFFFRDKIPFQHFRETMMPALLAARAGQRAAHPHLVRGGGQRPGTLFAGPIAQGDGRANRRLAHRDRCH
jgi:chemotaxis protein methyltransferase CheR